LIAEVLIEAADCQSRCLHHLSDTWPLQSLGAELPGGMAQDAASSFLFVISLVTHTELQQAAPSGRDDAAAVLNRHPRRGNGARPLSERVLIGRGSVHNRKRHIEQT